MESASRFGLDHLTRAAIPGDPDMRPTLLRVLTDLYVQKPTHTADEDRHYTELALRLLETADAATRSAVAQRLAQYRSSPRRVVDAVAREKRNSSGQPLWTSGSIVRNRERIDIHIASELNELFFAANSDERRLILLNLDVIAPALSTQIERSRDDELSARLEAAILSRNREAFAQDLAQALAIPRAQARRVADDDLGEPIVTAAKALNIRRGALYRILLFVNVGSLARVKALTELHHELPTAAAEHMVAIWRQLPNLDRPLERHRPVLWDDGWTSRAQTAGPPANHALLSSPQRRDAT
jgi:hypothetical protein